MRKGYVEYANAHQRTLLWNLKGHIKILLKLKFTFKILNVIIYQFSQYELVRNLGSVITNHY